MGFTLHRLRGAFALKTMFTVALVALGDVLFYQNGFGGGGALGLYGLAVLAAVAAARPAVIGRLPAAAALMLAAIYALAMIYDASLLAWSLFWVAAGIAVLLPRTAGFDDGWRWFQRLLLQFFVALGGPIPDLIRRKRARAKRSRGGGGLQRLLPVVILPALGAIAFATLFAAANPVIEQFLVSVSTPDIDGLTILRVVLWLILVWFVWSLMRPFAARHLMGTFDGRGDVHIPGVSPASVLLSLITFNALFLIQNAMDAAWLWRLMPLPDGMTLAQYAHRGAYPLVATALLAALFVLVALRPGSATASIPAVRWLVALWIGQNLFLVFNAALRTVDYVEAYSLTVLRISALLWMGLVAIGLVLVLWRMLANKSTAWLINANLAAAGLLLTGVCFIDLAEIAARWNVRHAREVDGDGAVLDLCYLNRLGGSALIPLIELEQRKLPEDLRRRVHQSRLEAYTHLRFQLREGGWDWVSQRRFDEANRLLGGNVGRQLSHVNADCHGRPYPAPLRAEIASPADPATPAPAPELTAEPQR